MMIRVIVAAPQGAGRLVNLVCLRPGLLEIGLIYRPWGDHWSRLSLARGYGSDMALVNG
jgi:hypothetical protein